MQGSYLRESQAQDLQHVAHHLYQHHDSSYYSIAAGTQQIEMSSSGDPAKLLLWLNCCIQSERAVSAVCAINGKGGVWLSFEAYQLSTHMEGAPDLKKFEQRATLDGRDRRKQTPHQQSQRLERTTIVQRGTLGVPHTSHVHIGHSRRTYQREFADTTTCKQSGFSQTRNRR